TSSTSCSTTAHPRRSRRSGWSTGRGRRPTHRRPRSSSGWATWRPTTEIPEGYSSGERVDRAVIAAVADDPRTPVRWLLPRRGAGLPQVAQARVGRPRLVRGSQGLPLPVPSDLGAEQAHGHGRVADPPGEHRVDRHTEVDPAGRHTELLVLPGEG